MAWGIPRGLTIDAPGPASTTRSPTRAPTVPASTTVNSSSREWLWGLTRVLGGMVTSRADRAPPESALVTL
jgi:hypothetical protein